MTIIETPDFENEDTIVDFLKNDLKYAHVFVIAFENKIGSSTVDVGQINKVLRQRLLETCKAIADFAIFARFGWHRREDPLKSKKNILSKLAIFGLGIFFVFRLSPIF